MKPTFYTRIPLIYSILFGMLFFIITIGTFGLGFIFYDFFICPKYWLNRRILWKYLKSNNLVFTKELMLKDIVEYKFNNFTVWYYSKQLKLTVHTESNDDLIGLFTSSFIEDKMIIKLIRRLNQLESNLKNYNYLMLK